MRWGVGQVTFGVIFNFSSAAFWTEQFVVGGFQVHGPGFFVIAIWK